MRKITLCFLAFILLTLPSLADEGMWIPMLLKKYNIEDQSLQKIYGIVIGKKISKGQRLSNWEAEHLTENQQLYAATDAWSCIKIYEVLKSGKFKSPIYKIQPSSL